MMLDLDAVRLFVLSAEFGSLTRAAEAAGTVQPVVSQRLKALEARLGRRLLDRTPRLVRLTHDGEAFLPHARALLAAHDRALRFGQEEPAPRFALGVSDHALGVGLTEVLRRLRAALPGGARARPRAGARAAPVAGLGGRAVRARVLARRGGGAARAGGGGPRGARLTPAGAGSAPRARRAVRRPPAAATGPRRPNGDRLGRPRDRRD